ncbi:lantibiotic dehydratase [Kitasatospora sp. NPDC092286]|uniref:lantibiotic dehydratase n=1 Tax=Kitasatospora sp. NPDC092286 TaxID=3364087 RepID=UPI00381057A4
MYRLVGPALIRAAARPADATPRWPDLADRTPAGAAAWRAWLRSAWADSQLVAAIEAAAGEQLTGRVHAVVAGRPIGTARLRRLTATVMHYALRAQGRATPFGLFAGVAACPIGDRAVAPLWGGSRTEARADAAWLAGVTTRLEALLADRLLAVANDLRVLRGERIVLPVQPHPAGKAPVEVSVRATRAVLAALEAASEPVSLGTLVGRLAARFPNAHLDQVRLMVGELVRQRLLLSCLRPSMTTTDPLGHLLAAVARAGADDNPEVVRITDDLRRLHAGLDRHNRLDTPQEQRAARAAITVPMSGSPEDGPLLMVDLRLAAGPVTLPARVAREAERAAELLTRLSPHPDGNPAWLAYHARFTERYGPGAVVPVTELVNPDTGLGYPARYRDSLLPETPARLRRRDARLLALAQKAAVEGAVEHILDDRTLEDLAPAPAPSAVQPHSELTVHLAATDIESLDAGAFTVTVVAAPRAAGTTTGRFLHLLDGAERDVLAKAISQAPTLRADAQPVQVSVPPLFTRVENVARTPALLPVLPLGEYPGPGGGPLKADGLGVCADERRMWLVSLTDRRPIEPRVLNAIEFRAHTQPLARFLCEITGAFTPVFTGFDWGAAGKLPFLPRLRRGRVVLSPARWNLPSADLPPRRAPWGEWERAARSWLVLYRVPGRVQLTQHDLKLPLDLDQPGHLVLLRDHLNQQASAVLTEAPAPEANGWCGDRAHEITFQLHSTRPPLPPTRRRPVHVTGHRDGHLPGASRWLYARLYGNPARVGEILARMPALLGRWVNDPAWWFLRHTDPEPHLRLRIGLPDPAAFALAAERTGAWAGELQAAGLLTRLQLDTYQPETGRYGRGAAMRQAEEVFAADSRAVLAQLAHADRTKADPGALTAASMVAIATALLGADAAARWLLEHVPRHTDHPLPRAARSLALALTEQPGAWPALANTLSGRDLIRAWRERAAALTDYRLLLDQQGELEPDEVVGALLHVHHARAIGIDPDHERACHRLARAVALTHTHVSERAR